MFWLITKKDLLIAFRDKSSWIILLLMPIVLILIFSAVFGNTGNFALFPVNVVLVNLDEGSGYPANLNEEFVRFLQSGDMQEMITLSTAVSVDEATRLIREGSVQAGIVIPNGFTKAFFGGEQSTVQVLGDAGSTIGPKVISSIMDSYMTILEANRVQYATIMQTMSGLPLRAELKQMVTGVVIHNATIKDLPLRFTETVEKGRTKLTISAYYAAAMAVMFLLFTGNHGIFSILEERGFRTMLRLKTTIVSKPSLILGKFITVAILGLVQLIVLIIFTSIVTKTHWGNSFFGLAYISLAGVSAISALAIFVASITTSANAANAVNWIAIQILAFFGGSYVPIDQLPPFVQTISKFTINGQALQGFTTLMQGGGFMDVLNIGLILFGMCVVFLGLGSYFLKFGGEGI